MTKNNYIIKEYKIYIHEDEEKVISKINKLKKLFGEKTDNKTIKKIIKEFEIK